MGIGASSKKLEEFATWRRRRAAKRHHLVGNARRDNSRAIDRAEKAAAAAAASEARSSSANAGPSVRGHSNIPSPHIPSPLLARLTTRSIAQRSGSKTALARLWRVAHETVTSLLAAVRQVLPRIEVVHYLDKFGAPPDPTKPREVFRYDFNINASLWEAKQMKLATECARAIESLPFGPSPAKGVRGELPPFPLGPAPRALPFGVCPFHKGKGPGRQLCAFPPPSARLPPPFPLGPAPSRTRRFGSGSKRRFGSGPKGTACRCVARGPAPPYTAPTPSRTRRFGSGSKRRFGSGPKGTACRCVARGPAPPYTALPHAFPPPSPSALPLPARGVSVAARSGVSVAARKGLHAVALPAALPRPTQPPPLPLQRGVLGQLPLRSSPLALAG